ncbi:MAG: glycosyltransferase family 2 protein [Chthoniobacteraceae bacterium]|jgi:dolichol-phosphate mannosyltransferase
MTETKSSPRRSGNWKLGIVTPLANEEENIAALLKAVLEQIGPEDRIFCVLDRISKDNTRAIIEGMAATEPRVVPVWAPENRCVVDAYFRGYREAFATGMDYILEMDGGFSHRPEEIPAFIAAADKGVDYAGGSRFMKGGSHKGSLKRRCVSKGGTILANLLLGTKMHDMCSGFECFSRRAMEAVLERGVKSRAHFFQTEIRYMMHDFNWVEIPINYSNPSDSVGSGTIKEAFGNLWLLRRQKKARKN